MARTPGSRYRFRVTPAGWAFLVLTVSFGAQGALAGNNLVFLIFAVMTGFGLSLAALTVAMPALVRVRRILPEAVSAGEAFDYTLELSNPRKSWTAICLQVTDHSVPAASKPAPAEAARIEPGSALALIQRMASPSRGWMVFDLIQVRCQFPFGLFVAERRLRIEDRILVYPERWVFQPRFRLNTPGGNLATADLPGRSNSDMADFAGLRDYHPGDHPRHIHWHASGRSPDQLLTRQFEPQHGRQVVILLDSLYPRREEARCRAALEENICLALALAEKFLSEEYEVILAGYSGGPRIFYLRPVAPELEDVRRWLALLQPEYECTWAEFMNSLRLPPQAGRVLLRLPGAPPPPPTRQTSSRPWTVEDLKPFAMPRRVAMAQTHTHFPIRS